MSGHSKWSKIKRDKQANDNDRSKQFSKIARIITVAVQLGGDNPEYNASLALAIEKAKSVNMPNDNIDRAIKKGSGNNAEDSKLEEVSYEAYYLKGKISLIIDTLTDNRNRTVGEVRSTIEKSGGVFAEAGSISWQFSTIGVIYLEFDNHDSHEKKPSWKEDPNKPIRLKKSEKEDFELSLYEVQGVKDVITDEVGIEIRTDYKLLHEVKKFIYDKKIEISEADVIKITDNLINISTEEESKLNEFIEKLEALDDVQKIWHNGLAD